MASTPINEGYKLSFTAAEIDERLAKMTDEYIQEKVLDMLVSVGVVSQYCDNDGAIFTL